MRKNIVAGNWKMNNNLSETTSLIENLKGELEGQDLNCRVIVSPSFVNLSAAVQSSNNSSIEVAAQNIHQKESGAYTGEVSADMLKGVGVKTVILGHSERRDYFNESDGLLSEKVQTALKHDLEVIFCFGETLKDRKAENELLEVSSQIKNALFDLPAESWKNIILAYEPVWAIGTGETATPEQVQEIHSFVRRILSKKFGEEVGNYTSILYGGSVKPANAKEIFSCEDVDGGLIGGASLNAKDFTAIIKAF